MIGNENSIAPAFEQGSFVCPHCGVRANMKWRSVLLDVQSSQSRAEIYRQIDQNRSTKSHPLYGIDIAQQMESDNWKGAVCDGCDLVSLWRNGEMVWPNISMAPKASADMPEDIVKVFNEAREIVHASPRAAAALLRLVIQMLCRHFGHEKKTLEKSIESLVSERGISEDSKRAFRIIRNVGNDQVHAGIIDLNDNLDLAYGLFKLANLVVQEMVTRSKFVDEIEALADNLLNKP